MIHYATLHQVRSYLKLKTAETSDDELLKDFVRASTRSIDKYTRRRFDVRLETRNYDYPVPKSGLHGVYKAEDFVYQMNAVADWVDARIKLDDDLLAVDTLTNGDDVEISSGDYVLEPANNYPKHSIKLVEDSDVSWQTGSSGERKQIIDVKGHWGYHDRYDSDAWCSSLDSVQDNPLSAGATEITVNDADGDAADTTGTRFQAGQLVKIEDELAFIVSVNYTTEKLTVIRGHHGTTAAEHVQGTVIYVFKPMEDVVLACVRLVAWRYRQKDSDVFDKQTILGTGIAITPSALPADIRELLPFPKPMRL
jgi:hypothetical protein